MQVFNINTDSDMREETHDILTVLLSLVKNIHGFQGKKPKVYDVTSGSKIVTNIAPAKQFQHVSQGSMDPNCRL